MMRRTEIFLWLIVFVAIIFGAIAMLDKAFAFDVCYDDGVFVVSNIDPDWGVGGAGDGSVQTGTTTLVLAGSIVQFWYQLEDGSWWYIDLTETVAENPDAYPSCHRAGEWQPGAPSVNIPLAYDCNRLEVKDSYGNWFLVVSNGQPVELKYGEALIASPYGQTLDPDDYRAVPCQ